MYDRTIHSTSKSVCMHLCTYTSMCTNTHASVHIILPESLRDYSKSIETVYCCIQCNVCLTCGIEKNLNKQF